MLLSEILASNKLVNTFFFQCLGSNLKICGVRQGPALEDSRQGLYH